MIDALHAFRRRAFLLIIPALLFVGGCSAKPLETVRAQDFVPGQGAMKVAVLPFQTTDAGQQEVAGVFREELYANLQEGPYALSGLARTDEILESLNLANPGQAMASLEADPKKLGDALGADAILLGRIAKWSLTYLAVHSQIGALGMVEQ